MQEFLQVHHTRKVLLKAKRLGPIKRRGANPEKGNLEQRH